MHRSGQKGRKTTQELTLLFPAVRSGSGSCTDRGTEVSWEGGAGPPCPELPVEGQEDVLKVRFTFSSVLWTVTRAVPIADPRQ